MDHAYFKDRISAYFDGALPPYEKRAVEEHLAQCAECRGMLAKLRALDSMVEKKSELGESDFWEQQAQKIEQRLGIGQTEVTRIQPTRTWQGLSWKLAAAAASIAVVGVIGFYSWESIREKTERPPIQMTPSIPPASVVAPQKTQKESENAGDMSISGETTVTKAEPIDSKRLTSDTQNYKRPAVMEKSVSGEVQETVNRAVIGKTGTMMKETLPPVQRIDDLLKSESDAAAKRDSEISVPQMLAPAPAAGETRPESIVITKDEALSEVVPKEPVIDSILASDSLAYWLAQEKGLIGGRTAKGKSAPSPLSFGAREKVTLQSALAQRKDSTDIQARLLVVYYQIARLSRDSSDVSRALSFLQRSAEDAKSPYQKTARSYLDSLGIK